MDEKPLPPNWEKRVDARTGWPYYVNHANQTTQWEDPRLEVKAATQNPNNKTNDQVDIPINVQSSQLGSQSPSQKSPQVTRERSPIAPERAANNSGSNTPRRLGSGHRNNNKAEMPLNQPTEYSGPVNIALNTIFSIKKESETFHVKIEAFTGVKDSTEYKYLEEMMERNLCKLDNIEANGNESIRTQRKDTVKYIQQCLDQLELKALANETDIPVQN